MQQEGTELQGLCVILDNLIHHYAPDELPPDRPHAFIYFLTIHNESKRKVTLLGRKWVVEETEGAKTRVIEGDKIVGKTPTLASGESFSYNSYHIANSSCIARGSFHGIDEDNNHIFVRIPEFKMSLPPELS